MKRLLPILLCAFASLLFGCNTTPDPVLTVTPENLAFSAEGGAQTVQVKANNPWTASASGSGISVNPSSGEGDATVTVTATATNSTNPLSGSVTFRSEGLAATVSVTQDERKVIQVGDVMVIPAEGGTFAVDIQYNTEYTVEVEASAKSWISFLGTRALQSGKLEFQFAENGNTEPRTGKVTVRDNSGKAAPVTLTFVQEEKKVITVGDVMTIPAEGGTFAVDIQYNTDFDVVVESGAQSWITFVATRALKSGKLEFRFAENQDTDPRQGKVTVKDKSGKVSDITLTFVQEEKKVITVGDVMEIPAEGGTFSVDVQYNTDVVVEVESAAQSWIHFVAVRALTSGKLEFSFDANPKPDARTGKVTVKDKNGKASGQTLTFVQKERVMIVVDDQDVITVPATESSYSIDVHYNLGGYYTIDIEEGARSWISVESLRSLTDGQFTLLFAANEGPERTGKIYINGGTDNISFEPKVITFIQKKDDNLLLLHRVMTDLYEALDAKNWKVDPWIPGENWPGLEYDFETGKAGISINYQEPKGYIPESIGDLGGMLTLFNIFDGTGITGTLPDSFRKLVNLETLQITKSQMTSLPDVFSDMKELKEVVITMNERMTGPLPVSLGECPKLEMLRLVSNKFTGEIPASWAWLGNRLWLGENCLSGKIPDSFFAQNDWEWLLFDILPQDKDYGFDISEVDLHGGVFWPKSKIEDINGNLFSFEDVIGKNKYTVYLNWSPWDPFSKTLVPRLRDYYDLYKQDGLEIIATIMANEEGHLWTDLERQRKEVKDNGYDKWYNFYFPQISTERWIAFVPSAEVYDSNGYILYSCNLGISDPVRERFGHVASFDLIPFLEEKLGPESPYASTDYSEDGKVLTLQQASVGKGINIVFMGDAYTDKDMAAGGLYETLMEEAMEEFFSIEPYKSFRNRFNVYAVKVVSKNGRIGDHYSTALSCYFGGGANVLGDQDKCYEYALKVPGINNQDNLLINVLVNSERSTGTTSMSYMRMSGVSFTASASNDHEIFGHVLRHEGGGHGFGFLADEYSNYSEPAPADHISNYTSMYEAYGWYSNVDFTSDPAKIHWSAFLSDERYKNEVGIFEGAALYEKGAFRPSEKSIMRYMDESDEFNAPSRWAIYQQIMKRSGEEPSFEKFLEYDAVNRASASSASAVRPPLKAAGKGNSVRLFEQGAPPVIVR